MPIAHFAEKRVRFLAAAVGAALAIAVIAVAPDSTAAIGSDNTWVSLGAIRAGHSTAAQATPFYSSSRNVFFASNSGGGTGVPTAATRSLREIRDCKTRECRVLAFRRDSNSMRWFLPRRRQGCIAAWTGRSTGPG